MSYENDETKAERELEELLKQQNGEGTSEPAGQVATPEPAAPTPEPAKPDDDGYKQRYLTLQGMMRSEREKWQAEKQQLTQQLAELKSRPTPKNESVEVEDDYRSEHVTDETRQSLAYRRLLELNGQRHTEIHFESLAMMNPKVEVKPEPQNNGMFFANLDRLVPVWRELNSNPEFVRFLAQVIPYSNGMTLQDKLNQAVQEQDAAAAAQFFIDFGERKIQPPATPTQPNELIAPPKRGSNAHIAAESNQGKVYTLAEWNAGWKQLELGNLSAKMAAELEADLTNAPNQGRVVG